MVRRTALVVAVLLALASLPMVAGVTAVGASPLSAASAVALAGPAPAGDDAVVRSAPAGPRDRGGDVGDDDSRARREEKKPKQKPCPEELWNIPLQIEGLACILLLPKKEEPPPVDEDDDDDRR